MIPGQRSLPRRGAAHASMVPRGRVRGRADVRRRPAAAAKQRPQDRLDAYTVVTTADKLAEFEAKGLDVADSEVTASDVRANMILTRAQAQDVRAAGAQRQAHARQGRQDRQAVRGRAGGQRLHRLEVLRRAGRLPRPDVRARAPVPGRHQARQDRHDAQGPRDPRAEGHAGRPRPEGRQAAGRAVQRHPARARVDRHGDRPPPDVPLRRGLGGRRHEDHEAAPVDRAVVRPGHEPGRLPVLVQRRAPVAQEPARQRRRQPDDERRRRRPEPQLPGALQVRRGGLLEDPFEPDLPRPRPRVRARDAGDHGPVGARRLRVQRQLPLQRPLAAVPGGLADQLADRRRPDLLRAVGQPRPAGDRGLPPGPELGRPLRHQRRGQRLHAQAGRRAGVDPGAEPGLPVVRVRVPRRRGAGPGGVRAQPAVRRVGRELRGGPG